MTQAKKRYYDDSLSVNKDLPSEWSAQYAQQLHILFAQWIRDNNLDRDFSSAVDQAVGLMFIQYLFDGMPSFEDSPAPDYEPAVLPSYKPADLSTPAKRYYDETSSINLQVDGSKFQAVVAVAFVQWVLQGWHARDFIQATGDICETLIYDFHLCCSMGGLGGGKDRKDFLTTPYA